MNTATPSTSLNLHSIHNRLRRLNHRLRQRKPGAEGGEFLAGLNKVICPVAAISVRQFTSHQTDNVIARR